MKTMKKYFFSFYNSLSKLLPTRYLARYPIFRDINYHVINYLRPSFVEIDGHKIFLDPKDSLGLSIAGDHEPLLKELMQKEIKEGDAVLDIGANIGYFSLMCAKLVGNKGKVFAFEPAPDNFALLEKNIKVNGYANIHPEQKAVSDMTGRINLYMEEYNQGDHRIFDSFDGRRAIQIEAVTLDDYFKQRNVEIDFIKMDAQGAEGRILKGAVRVLEQNPKVKILAEYWGQGLALSGVMPEVFINILLHYNYRLYDIHDGYKEVNSENMRVFMEAYSTQEKYYTNLLCKKK